MSPCPTPEMLSRLAGASATGSRFAAMESHVQCARTAGGPGTVGRRSVRLRGRGPARLAEPEHPHDRGFRDRARAGPRGDGGRLSGVAAATGPPGGHQGRPGERRDRCGGSPALASRGAGDRAGPPSQRRPAPRSGRTGRLSLPRPRPDRRGKPGGPRHRPFAGACRGRVDCDGRAGRGPDPPRRDVASRHQALEHLARRPARRSLGSGRADARRLRHRPGGRRPGRRRRPVRSECGVPLRSWPRNRLPATAPRSVRDPTSLPSGRPCTAS